MKAIGLEEYGDRNEDSQNDHDRQDAFILDAKYKATTGDEVAEKQSHLTEDQQRMLAQALKNTDELFDGKLGHYKPEKIHL
eukprot:13064590-Ditylum_brightwellii.AAC.1